MHRKLRLLGTALALVVLLASVGGVGNASTHQGALQLEDALRIASTRSPSVARAKARVELAEAQLSKAVALSEKGGLEWEQYIRSRYPYYVIPSEQVTKAIITSHEADLEAAREAVKLEEHMARRNALALWYDWHAARHRLAAAEHGLSKAKAHLDYVMESWIWRSEVLTATAEVVRAEAELRAANENVRIVEFRLREMLGYSTDVPLELAELPEWTLTQPADLTVYLERGFRNVDVKAAEATLAARKADLAVAKANLPEGHPDLAIALAAVREAEANLLVVQEQTRDNIAVRYARLVESIAQVDVAKAELEAAQKSLDEVRYESSPSGREKIAAVKERVALAEQRYVMALGQALLAQADLEALSPGW